MRKFETNARYYESGLTYEVVKRTAKKVTVNIIQHAGRFNERITGTKTVKILDWKNGEAFIIGENTVEA